MFGPKLTNVFRSRWHALLWAGFVMMTAYCSVPAQNEPGDAEAVAALVAAAKHKQAKSEHHANPWARETR